jgi:hypothetical protein
MSRRVEEFLDMEDLVASVKTRTNVPAPNLKSAGKSPKSRVSFGRGKDQMSGGRAGFTVVSSASSMAEVEQLNISEREACKFILEQIESARYVLDPDYQNDESSEPAQQDLITSLFMLAVRVALVLRLYCAFVALVLR